MKNFKKVVVFLIVVSVILGVAGNANNINEKIEKFNDGEYTTEKPTKIAYLMMDSGLEAEILDVLGCTIHGCKSVNGVLLKVGDEVEEVSLYYITSQVEYDRAVRMYEDMNRLYEEIGTYYRIHQNGKVLLVAGGSHSEESFKKVSKQLDYVMR